MLYLYKTQSDALDSAFNEVARENAGAMLVTRVNVSENPSVHGDFGNMAVPALLTLDDGEIESKAGNIRAQDVYEHADFLMGRGPMPTETAAEVEQRSATGNAPVHISDATFQKEVLESDIPVLVDFWAPWCGPCHMIAPSLEKLAHEYTGKAKIAKLNVDENRQTAMQYRAQGIPMLLMFKHGQVVGKLVGAHPEPNIEQLIRQAV